MRERVCGKLREDAHTGSPGGMPMRERVRGPMRVVFC